MNAPIWQMWRNGMFVLLLFMLLREWMLPLAQWPEVTGIGEIEPFLLAMMLFLLVQYLRCPLFLALSLQALICLAVSAHLFQQDSLLQMSFWNNWFDILRTDVAHVLNYNWYLVSGEVRTFLFLYGWSLVVYVIYALLVDKRSGGWFVAATFSYLFVLQYAFGLDTSMGMVRTFVFGMLLVVASRMWLLPRQEHASPFHWRGIGVVVVVVSIAVSASFWLADYTVSVRADKGAPAATVLEPLLLPLLETAGTTGYDEDDTRLGAPVRQDMGVAFFARTSALTYWKGETKRIYDGKGWRDEAWGWQSKHVEEPGIDEKNHASDDTETSEAQVLYQEIMPVDPHLRTTVFRGGPIIQVERMLDRAGGNIPSERLRFNPLADKYELPQDAGVVFYRIAVSMEQPGMSVDTATENLTHDGADENPGATELQASADAALERFLQLPERLPRRVVELAEDVVSDVVEPEEMASRIESFLRAEYDYSLSATARPGADEDFVDHFLFAQRAGYCDHFSTAMVVMMRTLGVPARWVKGFAPGDVVAHADGMYEVAVRNKHAHSWAEVYLPDKGWTAFEPTLAFDNDGGGAGDEPEAEGPPAQEHSTTAMAAVDDRNSTLSVERFARMFSIGYDRWEAWIAGDKWPRQLAVAVSMVLASVVLFIALRALYEEVASVFLLRALARSRSVSEAEPLVARLWQRLFRKYGARQHGQTLREYVSCLPVSNTAKREAFRQFMRVSEILYFHTRLPGRNWRRKLAKLWVKSS